MSEAESKVADIIIVGTAFVSLMLVALMVFVYIHQLRVKKLNLEIELKEQRKRDELNAAVLEGEERERRRLAEELHDGTGSKLSAIKFGLEYIEGIIDKDPAMSADELRKNILSLNESINELREISHNLQPGFISQIGLRDGMTSLLNQFRQNNKTQYTLFVDPTLQIDGQPQLLIHVYRMVSELLLNISKHANATLASVQLIESGGQVVITVEDNGVGIKTEAGRGVGLINIRNRVESLGGSVNMDTGGGGTTMIIEIPQKGNKT